MLATTLLLIVAALVPGTSSARPDTKAVFSPVSFDVIDRPQPVLASDGRFHLVYEVQAVNQSALTVSITRIQGRAQGGTIGKAVTGTSLSEITRLGNGTTGSSTLGAGEGAIFFLDTSYSKKRRTPKAISHAITMSWPDPVNIGQTSKQTVITASSKVSPYMTRHSASPKPANAMTVSWKHAGAASQWSRSWSWRDFSRSLPRPPRHPLHPTGGP